MILVWWSFHTQINHISWRWNTENALKPQIGTTNLNLQYSAALTAVCIFNSGEQYEMNKQCSRSYVLPCPLAGCEGTYIKWLRPPSGPTKLRGDFNNHGYPWYQHSVISCTFVRFTGREEIQILCLQTGGLSCRVLKKG